LTGVVLAGMQLANAGEDGL